VVADCDGTSSHRETIKPTVHSRSAALVNEPNSRLSRQNRFGCGLRQNLWRPRHSRSRNRGAEINARRPVSRCGGRRRRRTFRAVQGGRLKDAQRHGDTVDRDAGRGSKRSRLDDHPHGPDHLAVLQLGPQPDFLPTCRGSSVVLFPIAMEPELERNRLHFRRHVLTRAGCGEPPADKRWRIRL
jgi:hypothetical protein